MKIPLVDLKAQYENIKDEIDATISEVISKAAFISGPFVESFETSFAEYCGVRYCIGVGNGTDALFIALKALGIGDGAEVITAANTFIATSEAISMAGAKVVFVDINPKTYNIDSEKIEEKITKQTRAIIPVHLYGQPADMDPISDIAQKHELKIIEDASQAHGAKYKGRNIGSLGDMACFSFYPGKNLGAYGDAGAIVTNNAGLALKARMIANHGRTEKYNHELEGVNSRLDGIQAAILSVKLKHLDQWTENRRRIAYQYDEKLKHLNLTLPTEIEEVKAVYHLYVVRVESKTRDKLRKHLNSNKIATGIHYPIALPNLIAYKYLKHNEEDFPEAAKASNQILSLPIFPELRKSQIEYVVEKIRGFQT